MTVDIGEEGKDEDTDCFMAAEFEEDGHGNIFIPSGMEKVAEQRLTM